MKSKSSLIKLALQGLAITSTLAACESDKSTSANSVDNTKAMNDFKSACSTAGNIIHETTCKGTATCAGTYYDKATNKVIQTTCAGTNSCEGIQCLSKTGMSSMGASSMTNMSSMSNSSSMNSMSSTAMSSAASVSLAKTKLLAAPTADAFKAACTEAGKSAIESVCNGHNDCAGIYFHTGSYGSKIMAVENTCKGTNTCAGFKCEI